MKSSLVFFFFLLALVAVATATTNFDLKIVTNKAFSNQVAFQAALDSCSTTESVTSKCVFPDDTEEDHTFPAIPNIFGTAFVPYLAGNDIIAEVTFPGDDLAFKYALCYLRQACGSVFDSGEDLVSIEQPVVSTDELCFDTTTCGASSFCLCGSFEAKIFPGKAFPNQVAFQAALDSCSTTESVTSKCVFPDGTEEDHTFPVIPNIFGTAFVPYLAGNDIIAEVTFPGGLAFKYALCYLRQACGSVFDFGDNLVLIQQAGSTNELCFVDPITFTPITTCGSSNFCLCGPGATCTADEQCSTGKCSVLDGEQSCETDHAVALEITLAKSDAASLEVAQKSLAFILSSEVLVGQLTAWMNYCTVLISSPRQEVDLTNAIAKFWIQPNSLNAPKCDPAIVNYAFSQVPELAGIIVASAAVIPSDQYPDSCLIPGGGFYCAVVPGCEYLACQPSDFTNGSGQCETATQCVSGESCHDGLCNSAVGYSFAVIVIATLAALFF